MNQLQLERAKHACKKYLEGDTTITLYDDAARLYNVLSDIIRDFEKGPVPIAKVSDTYQSRYTLEWLADRSYPEGTLLYASNPPQVVVNIPKLVGYVWKDRLNLMIHDRVVNNATVWYDPDVAYDESHQIPVFVECEHYPKFEGKSKLSDEEVLSYANKYGIYHPYYKEISFTREGILEFAKEIQNER